MLRRYAGRSAVRIAPAAAAIALLISGCGQTQTGSAAMVSSGNISVSKLSAEVSNLQSAAGRLHVALPASGAGISRQVLTWMLTFSIAEQLAVREHVASQVTAFRQQQAIASVRAAVRSSGGGTLTKAAVRAGLPPDLLPEYGRYEVIVSLVQQKLDHHVAPKTQAEIQALTAKVTHLKCLAAKSLSISVNPQFGMFDYNSYQVIAAASSLSAPSVPTPAPTATPRLTPPC